MLDPNPGGLTPGLLPTEPLTLIMSDPEVWPFIPHCRSSLPSCLVLVLPDLPLVDLVSFLSLWDHVDPFFSANFFHILRFWLFPSFYFYFSCLLSFSLLSLFFMFCFFLFFLFIYPGQFHPFPQFQNQCRNLSSFLSFTSNSTWHLNLNIPVTPQTQHVQRWIYCLPFTILSISQPHHCLLTQMRWWDVERTQAREIRRHGFHCLTCWLYNLEVVIQPYLQSKRLDWMIFDAFQLCISTTLDVPLLSLFYLF